MRILHVLEANQGGTALHVRHLATAQARAGHAVAVAAPTARSWGVTDDKLVAELDGAGAEVWPTPMVRSPVSPVNARAVSTLTRQIRRWRPDVVHTHSSIGGLVGRAAARLADRPAVHTPNGVHFSDPEPGVTARASRALERAAAPFTRFVVAVSESEGKVLRTVYRHDQVVVVANGVPARPEPPAPFPDPPTVVCVSRFDHQKDPLASIEVMARARRAVPGSRAVLIGSGELEPEVRRLATELDPGIEIRQDIPGPVAIAESTVTLLCTRWEGGPYVLLEAMERSRPVVATDAVGCRDVVVDGETGYLHALGDTITAADRVAELLAEPATAEKMGAAGRARLLDGYTVETMVDRVHAVYERVVPAAR